MNFGMTLMCPFGGGGGVGAGRSVASGDDVFSAGQARVFVAKVEDRSVYFRLFLADFRHAPAVEKRREKKKRIYFYGESHGVSRRE